MIFLAFAVLGFSYVLLKFYFYEDKKPIFDIYQQKSKWFPFKYALFLIIFYTVKYTMKLLRFSEEKAQDVDRPLQLVRHIKAFDGILFTGGNRQGYYFVVAAERCHKRVVNGFFYLLVPHKGLLCSSRLPDTILFDGEADCFGAEGLKITPLVSMKKWKLTYKGFMWLYPNRETKFRVRFTALWSTTYASFDCSQDVHPLSLARSVAMQPWTVEFFNKMKRSRIVEYYQMGTMDVESVIGVEKCNFQTLSLRCRSFGTNKDLSSLHRTAHFHIFLENGLTAFIGFISHHLGIISLETGYVQRTDGSIHPVSWCDFQLYQHGECGRPPLDHGFQFKAGDVVYTIQFKVVYEHLHFTGWNWELKIIIGFGKCVMNGVFGQSISEFQYTNKNGRPAALNERDPNWFKVYRPHYVYS